MKDEDNEKDKLIETLEKLKDTLKTLEKDLEDENN